VIYYGQLQANMKHGLGVLARHRTLTFSQVQKNLLEGFTSRTYRRLIDKELETAHREVERARARVKKVQGLFVSGQLKEVLKKYNKPYNPQMSLEK